MATVGCARSMDLGGTTGAADPGESDLWSSWDRDRHLPHRPTLPNLSTAELGPLFFADGQQATFRNRSKATRGISLHREYSRAALYLFLERRRKQCSARTDIDTIFVLAHTSPTRPGSRSVAPADTVFRSGSKGWHEPDACDPLGGGDYRTIKSVSISDAISARGRRWAGQIHSLHGCRYGSHRWQ